MLSISTTQSTSEEKAKISENIQDVSQLCETIIIRHITHLEQKNVTNKEKFFENINKKRQASLL